MNILKATKYAAVKDYLLLLFITLIAYWPLSLHLFSLKNDALVQYLTYRYHLSEAIQNGYFPFWSPYLYTGFPIHADIQGAVWNPFVWILSLISKYNMTVLQCEVLIYLYLTGIGMYKLIRYLKLSRPTAVCCAVSFLCCGYITDSISIIPWIPSAAFIPFILLYFLKLINNRSTINVLKFSFSVCLMFLCGYPSFFIFLNYILFITAIFWFFNQVKQNNTKYAARTIFYIGIAYVLFLLICSPAIISYYEFLPYYTRGGGLSFSRAITNSFKPFSILSYFFANATSKVDFLDTDLSMRNSYIGLFIVMFFLHALFKLTPFQKSILGFTIFSFLFSLGDLTPVQKLSYHFIPLMNTFRHPATIRVFTTIGMILISAHSLEKFFLARADKKLLFISYGLMFSIIAGTIYFLLKDSQEAISTNFSFSPTKLKLLLHEISFEKLAIWIGLAQVIFFALFIYLTYKTKINKISFVLLFIFNSLVFAFISLPFTVVSQYKTATVNQYINSFPDGYPAINVNKSVESERFSNPKYFSVHGYPNFYNKRITIQDYVVTPTLNSDYGQFLKDTGLRKELAGYPFVYSTDTNHHRINSDIVLRKFMPNFFVFEINTNRPGYLTLFQQYNHNWNAKVDNVIIPVQKVNFAFMRVPIKAGTSVVEWSYKPSKVYAAMIISFLTVFLALIYLIRRKKTINDI